MTTLDSALAADDLSAALRQLSALDSPVLDIFPSEFGDLRRGSPRDAQFLRDVSDGSTVGAPRGLPESRGQRQTVGLFQEKAAHVLDLALQEKEMSDVALAYQWLTRVGVLRSFGRDKETLLNAEPRLVTPTTLRAFSGLDVTKLSPKKWGSNNSFAPIAVIAFFSLLINNGIDVRPLLIILLALGVIDSLYLGGAAQYQFLSLWPGYKKRVLVHEAGHVLAAYLLGCPVRGVILDATAAADLGIQGQAGTQFWDSTLDSEIKANKLSGASVDRYSVVLFAGIAAEALVFGEAEGGESDENIFKALVGELQPAWPPAKVSNQARWAVLQAFTILRKNKKALDAVVAALADAKPMGDIVLAIESSLAVEG